MSSGSRGAAAVVLASLLTLALAGTAAAGPDTKAQIVPLGMNIEHSPNPVLGADGKNHLVYEITIVNQTPGEVTIQSVQARAGGRPIGARLQGQSLADLLRINSGGGPAISERRERAPVHGCAVPEERSAAQAAYPCRHHVVQPASAARQELQLRRRPDRVGQVPRDRGRQAAERPALGGGQRLLQPDQLPSRRNTVDRRNRTRSRALRNRLGPARPERPPLRGSRTTNSRATRTSATRSTRSPRARVVGIRDGMAEQTPGSLPSGQTVQTAAGNHIVVKLAPKRFALYAHMQPGSPRVEIGRPRPQGPSPRAARQHWQHRRPAPALPHHGRTVAAAVEWASLRAPPLHGPGPVTDEALLQSGEIVPVNTQVLRGRFRSVMPMGLQVVDFGD